MKLTTLEKLFDQYPSLNEMIRDTILSRKDDEGFCLCDPSDIIRKHENWLVKMPRVRPFYAIKCNPTPIVVEILAALGIGFDCASQKEIDTVLDLGVPPDDIIYANPCKTKAHISHASSRGVDYMTFDNELELYKVRQLHPNAKMVLRIKVDDSHSLIKLGNKFGALMKTVPKLLAVAKSIGVEVVGCSFHVGSVCGNTDAYRKAIADARVVFDLGEEMGFNMMYLDIGGGFPGTDRVPIHFDVIAQAVNKSLSLHFPEFDRFGNPSKVRIIAEPGRYFVASAFTVVTSILAKRMDVPDDLEEIPMDANNNPIAVEPMTMYYLNDGVYGSFNFARRENDYLLPIPFPLHEKFEGRPFHLSTLWGPTCDSVDYVLSGVLLPDMKIGEWICFPDMGAYSICLQSPFNGFKGPELKYYLTRYTLDKLQASPGWPRIFNIIEQSNIVGDVEEPQVNNNNSMSMSAVFVADNCNSLVQEQRFIPVR